MARKRIFLDECNSDLGHVFGPKDHMYTAKDFGITGKEDLKAIDVAVKKKCSTCDDSDRGKDASEGRPDTCRYDPNHKR